MCFVMNKLSKICEKWETKGSFIVVIKTMKAKKTSALMKMAKIYGID